MAENVSRTGKSAKNLMVGIFGHVFTLLLSFIVRTVFIKCLSTEYLGINGLFANILTVLSFAELGIGDALVFAMYKPAKENNYKKLEQLLCFYRSAYRWIAVVVGVIGFTLSFFIDFLVAEKPSIPENFQVIFWLFLLNNVCSYLLVYKQSVLTVAQNNYIISLIRMSVKTLEILMQAAILIFTGNYYLYLIVQIIGSVGSNLAISVYVNKHYEWTRKKPQEKLDATEKKEIFKDIKALSISKIASVVSNGSDNLIIAKFIGLSSVGIVSNYTMIINSVYSFLWSAVSGLSGSFGNLNVDATIDKKRRVFNELYLLTHWIYTFVSVCIMVLATPFIHVWIGAGFSTSQAVVVALVLISYIGGINYPIFTFRTTSGYFDEAKNAYVMFGVVNVILSLILAQNWGLFGVYIATSISRLCTSEIREGYVVYKKVLALPFYKYLIRYLVTMSIFFADYGITYWLVNLVSCKGIIGFALKAIVCAVVSNAVLLMCYFHTQALKDVMKRVKFLVKKS